MCSEFLRPIFFHDLPPSKDLYTPSPYATDLWLLFSPVPTQTTFGFSGSTATHPMEYELSLSNIGSKLTPQFCVFQTPPDATAT